MMVLYTGHNEGPALMDLETLVQNFDQNGGWYPPGRRAAILEDMRCDLQGVGWFEGLHDNGRYLVLNLVKLQLTSTADEGHSRLAELMEGDCKRNGHRDTGRGVCADCGGAL